MARCGCASGTCACTVTAGEGITVTGAGSPKNPLVITNNLSHADTGVTVQKDNVTVVPLAETLDFRGAGVVVTSGGSNEAVVTVAGGGGGTGDTFPPGVIMPYAGTAAPTGWLLCNGAQFAFTTYPALAALLGSRFGGDGSTVFNVPDMRDRFPVGVSATRPLASTGGAATAAIGTANLTPHNHTIAHQHKIDYSAGTGSTGANIPMGNSTLDRQSEFAVGQPTVATSGNGPGSATPMPIMPPFLSLNYIIKT